MTTDSPVRAGPTWTAVAAVALLVAALASLSGSTAMRALMVGVVGFGVFTLAARSWGQRPPQWLTATITAMVVAGLLHVLATSRFVATLYDAHMTPSWALPSGSTRLAVAWLAVVLWSAVLASGTVGGPRPRRMLLGAVAVLPVLDGTAFPTDAYWLLWNTSAFGSWPYSVGAVAVAVLLALDLLTTKRRSEVRSDVEVRR